MSEQKRSFSFLLILVALLVAGGAGAYFYLQGTWRKLTPLDSAKLVPEDTLLAAYIDNDSPNWSKLQQFGTPEAQTAIAQGFDELQKYISEEANLNYQTDLKPWVGDVMFAILPAPASPEASVSTNGNENENESESVSAEMESSETAENSEPNLLLVVGIQNPLKAWIFNRNLKSKETVNTETSDYKGITISTTTFEDDPPTYSAVIGKHLVMAEDRYTVEKAIETYQGSASLATTGSDSLEMLEKGHSLGSSIVQMYLPNPTLLTQQIEENSSENAEAYQEVNAIDYAFIGADIEKSGMRIQAITKVDPESFPQIEPPATDSLLLNRFPSETMALITGHKINRYWEMVVKQTSNEPMIQEMFDAMRSAIKDTVNLDVDRDIFSWMDGQFALGLISSNQGLLAQLGFGGAILLETSDRPLAEASLNKFDESLKNSLPFPLESEANTYQDIQITEWKIPIQGLILGGYGWLDETLLLIGVGQPMIEVMSQEVSNHLNTSENFQTIAGSLPTPNQGYFYLDMDQVMALVNRIPLPPGNQIPPETLAILNSIQGMGVTSHWPESEMNQMDMWLAFKPGQ